MFLAAKEHAQAFFAMKKFVAIQKHSSEKYILGIRQTEFSASAIRNEHASSINCMFQRHTKACKFCTKVFIMAFVIRIKSLLRQTKDEEDVIKGLGTGKKSWQACLEILLWEI